MNKKGPIPFNVCGLVVLEGGGPFGEKYIQESKLRGRNRNEEKGCVNMGRTQCECFSHWNRGWS